MAYILVKREGDGAVTWQERVGSDDLATDHFRRCLVDRLAWAVADAECSASPASALVDVLPAAEAQREREPIAA